MKSVTKTQEDPEIRIVKTAICPSLSGKSKLTYQIGCKDKADIQFRVTKNSSSGSFCDSWVALGAIQQAFEKNPRGEVLTGYAIESLFRGKSQNTPYFILAALKNEGLVDLSDTERRCYQRVDPKQFMAKIQALIDGKEEGKGKKPARKSATAKQTTAPKKTTSPKKRNSPS